MTSLRTITAYMIAPALMATGFRFSKDYRWGATRFHRIIYSLTNTVTANHVAGL